MQNFIQEKIDVKTCLLFSKDVKNHIYFYVAATLKDFIARDFSDIDYILTHMTGAYRSHSMTFKKIGTT